MTSITMPLSRWILVSIHCFGNSRGSSSGLFASGQLCRPAVAIALKQDERYDAQQDKDDVGDGECSLVLYGQRVYASIAEEGGDHEEAAAGEPADDAAVTMETAEGIREQ